LADPESQNIGERVLPQYEGWTGAVVEAVPSGLINRTFLVTAGEQRAVLQRVSPIFAPGIHFNIQAVTTHLARAGLATPMLIATRAGQLWAESGGQIYRLLSYVDGACFDRVASAGQARAAGALIGRFHRALEDLTYVFVHRRAGAHDTERHLERLAAAVTASAGHRLTSEVASLATEIAAGAVRLPPLPLLAPRVCHGDLKFNNVRFAGLLPPGSEHAVCLIDLDTVGPMSLAHEMGDALRSWCNRNGEDCAEAALDLDLFAAVAEGYRAARSLSDDERRGLLAGPEWISLELAARFATDAVEEKYFGWDRGGFPGRGEHNLVRARGQWSLHLALVASRAQRARLLHVT
jgi:Ser/Thr protein kinase RdoA (MazF antagonist)